MANNDKPRIGLWKATDRESGAEKRTSAGDLFYVGSVKERLVIEAGSKVTLFKNRSDNPKAPALNIVIDAPRNSPAQTVARVGAELGLSDDAQREIVSELTGKTSRADLTDDDAERVITAMRMRAKAQRSADSNTGPNDDLPF